MSGLSQSFLPVPSVGPKGDRTPFPRCHLCPHAGIVTLSWLWALQEHRTRGFGQSKALLALSRFIKLIKNPPPDPGPVPVAAPGACWALITPCLGAQSSQLVFPRPWKSCQAVQDKIPYKSTLDNLLCKHREEMEGSKIHTQVGNPS